METWNPLTGTGTPLDVLFGTGGSPGLFSDPSGAWDKFKNGETNEVNKEIAEENLAYQRERNDIEDARYEEETAYNRTFQEDERDYQRSFAEDERAYNRALQEKLFEREDTAIERQAQSLSKLGINPLSQNLNGLGAGQALTASTPGVSSAPNASSRGGQALHNDFKMSDTGVLNALAPLASLANTINQVATGQGQRDLLNAQRDKQLLENAILAHDYGIDLFGSGKNRNVSLSFIGNNDFGWNRSKGWKNDFNTGSSYSNFYKGLNDEREYQGKQKAGIFDYQPDFAKNLNYILSDDFLQTAEKTLTKGSELFDKALNNGISDESKKFKNPFSAFLNLFW